jgi:hypothetical protein
LASTSLDAAGGSPHWVAVPGSSQALTEIAAPAIRLVRARLLERKRRREVWGEVGGMEV